MNDVSSTQLSWPPQIGLGTYRLGDQTERVCLKALELGYRHIDTASIYRNEEAVAKAIKLSGIPREQVFVTTKISMADIEEGCVRQATERALTIFGQIDLLLLHGPTANLQSAWDELRRISANEAIDEIGVSNFDVRHLELIAHDCPAWNQIELSPFLQRKKLAAYCAQGGVHVVAHSLLTKGQKLQHSIIQKTAHAHDSSAAEILIAWTLQRGYRAIPRSTNSEHLAVNLRASSVFLSESETEELDSLEEGFATHPQHLE